MQGNNSSHSNQILLIYINLFQKIIQYSKDTPLHHTCKIPPWKMHRRTNLDELTNACSSIMDLIESVSHLLDISTGLVSLNIASVMNEHQQPRKENEEKFAVKLIKLLCGAAKLPTTAAGALRLYINCSSNQYNNLKTFLHAASLEYKSPSLDFLPNEKSLRKEDNSSFPGNVTYTIFGSGNEVLYTHDAKVFSFQ